MNNFQIQAFVRQIIAEAKAKKDEPKKDIKKPIKKEAKEEKSSGKLVDLKKELKEKQEELNKINSFIKDLSGITVSRSKYSDIEVIGDTINDLDADIKSLEEEKKKLEEDIASLKEKTSSEIDKIKEMIGITPKGKQKKMVDEKKDELEEARFKKGTDINKKGPGFKELEKKAAKEYGSKETGKKVAGAKLKQILAKKK